MLQLPFQMPPFPGFTLLLMSCSRMAFQRQTYPCVIGTCFLFLVMIGSHMSPVYKLFLLGLEEE